MKKLVAILALCVVCVFSAVCFTACKDGVDGKDGISVKTAIIDEYGDLIITLTDDTVKNAGKVVNNENPQELDFYLKNDGTYEVYVGNAKFLESIEIPSTYKGKAVTSIGRNAFRDCENLTSVTIPKCVTCLESSAFSYNKLQNIYYTGTISEWVQIDGLNSFMTENGTLYINNEPLTNAVLEGVTEIKPYAFSYCSSLTSITIPDSVTSIGYAAFYCCSSLKSITIPDSVTSIGNRAFAGCNSLQYNEYDNGYYLGNSANPYLVFKTAKSRDITSCKIHDYTKFISTLAFYGCSSLTSITIPNGVTSIEEAAFNDCLSLTSLTFDGTIEQWTAIRKTIWYDSYFPSTIYCVDGVINI